MRKQLVEVFVREGCPHCAKAEEFLARLARERPDLDIVIRDVTQGARRAAAPAGNRHAADRRGNARVPAFFVGGQMIFGYSEEASTDKLIRGALQGQKARPRPAAEGLSCAAQEDSTCRAEEQAAAEDLRGDDVRQHGALDDVGLPAFTIAMGLLDGLNPCSMWVLILMISLLSTLNDRKRMLAIAGTFVLVEGIAYFVFMAAWLNLFLLIGLSRASQLVIAAIAIVAGLINLKDFWAPGVGPVAVDIRQVQARHLRPHARPSCTRRACRPRSSASSSWGCWSRSSSSSAPRDSRRCSRAS